MRSHVCVLALACVASAAHARPVTFPGGSMGMVEVDGSNVMTQVDHTLSRQFALGGYVLTESDGDRRSAGIVGNWLALRRNTADSQANVYVLAGAGPSWVRRGQGRETVASGWLGGETDWETRRLFLGASARVSAVGGDTQVGYRLRAGVAPYVAPAGSLHTWLFLQAGRAASPGRRFEVTPLLRMFKGQVLAEAGVSSRGNGLATFWFYF